MKNFKKVTAAIAATLMAATMVAPMALSSFAAVKSDYTTDITISDLNDAGSSAFTDWKTENDKTDDDFNEWLRDVVTDTDDYFKAVTPDPVVPGATANKITFKDEVGTVHKYTAYQIFKGTLNASGVLEDPQWANNTTANVVIAAVNKQITVDANKLADNATAAAVAAKISGFTSNSAEVKAIAKELEASLSSLEKVNATAGSEIDITTTGDGWYLVVDETGQTAATNPFAYSSYILQSVSAANGIQVTVKSSAPSVVKKVKEDDKTVTGAAGITDGYLTAGDKLNDTADYSIGENVPFKLIATMPSNLTEYDHYYVKFTDNLGAGFKMPEKFTVAGVGGATAAEITVGSNGTCTCENTNVTASVTGSDETGWVITVEVIDVLKDVTDKTTVQAGNITVDYNAELDKDAVIARPGNYNDVKLTYSNNPKNTGDGTSAPGDENTGDTDYDGVVVFTYDFDIDKYNAAVEDKSDKLAGAKFNLYDSNAEKWLAISEDGEYTWITGDATKITDGVGISGAAVLESDPNGKVYVKGLDAGAYSLYEFKAPEGFNRIESAIPLTIVAETANNQAQDSIGGPASTARTGEQLTSYKVTKDSTDSVATLDIDNKVAPKVEVGNNSGTTLPSTGGIGTTLFYLGGGAMVAVAGVFLITKKRMKKEEA